MTAKPMFLHIGFAQHEEREVREAIRRRPRSHRRGARASLAVYRAIDGRNWARVSRSAQQSLNFFALPQTHGSLRPIFFGGAAAIAAGSGYLRGRFSRRWRRPPYADG